MIAASGCSLAAPTPPTTPAAGSERASPLEPRRIITPYSCAFRLKAEATSSGGAMRVWAFVAFAAISITVSGAAQAPQAPAQAPPAGPRQGGPGPGAFGAPPLPPGQAAYERDCASCH